MATTWVITTGKTALVAATAKTVIEGSAGANTPPGWIAMDISFDNAATAGNVGVLCEFGTIVTTGTGTAYTPKRLGGPTGVATSTWKINDTVEPTTFAPIAGLLVPPSGLWGYQFPLGRGLDQNVSTVFGIRLTAPAVVNYLVNLYIEE